MPDDLTPVQRSTLLVLMTLAREKVPNAELTTYWKLDLRRPQRDDLEKRRYIAVIKEKGRYFLTLSDKGAEWCRQRQVGEVPKGLGHLGALAYALLAGIQRHLDRTGISLPEFFVQIDGPDQPEDSARTITENLPASDLETRVRKAYGELASGPGSWVKLADLRPLLGGAARAEVDRTLVFMNRTPEVTIAPESNQKTLTDQDRAAAIWIGNQEKHLVAIGSA